MIARYSVLVPRKALISGSISLSLTATCSGLDEVVEYGELQPHLPASLRDRVQAE